MPIESPNNIMYLDVADQLTGELPVRSFSSILSSDPPVRKSVTTVGDGSPSKPFRLYPIKCTTVG